MTKVVYRAEISEPSMQGIGQALENIGILARDPSKLLLLCNAKWHDNYVQSDPVMVKRPTHPTHMGSTFGINIILWEAIGDTAMLVYGPSLGEMTK